MVTSPKATMLPGSWLADEGMAERLDGADVVPEGWSAGVSSYPDGDGGDQAAFDVVDASGVIDAGCRRRGVSGGRPTCCRGSRVTVASGRW